MRASRTQRGPASLAARNAISGIQTLVSWNPRIKSKQPCAAGGRLEIARPFASLTINDSMYRAFRTSSILRKARNFAGPAMNVRATARLTVA